MFDATHAEILRWVAAGESTASGSTTPTGCATRPATSSGCATAAPDAWIVVEKILECGEDLPAWPVDGHHRVRRPARGLRRLRRPGRGDRRSPRSTPTLTGVRVSWPELTHACKLEVGPPAVHRRSCAGWPRWPPRCRTPRTRSPSWRPTSRSTARTAPRGCGTSPEARSEAGRRRPDLTPALDALTARLRDPGDELAAAVPAADRRRHGQGRRGHRLLPVDPVRRAQRGRRHAGAVRGRRRASSTRAGDIAGSGAGRRGMTTLSTHDTKRGEDVRARLAVLAGGAGPVGSGRCAGGCAPRRCPTRRSRTCCGRRWSAPGRSSASGCTRTSRRRPARRRRRRAGPTRTRSFEARAARAWSTGSTTTPTLNADVADVRRRRSRRPAGPTRSGRSSCSSRCPACRTSTRAPSCGRTRWSTPTTGARSTSPSGPTLLARLDGGWRARRSTPAARRNCWSSRATLRLRRDRPDLFAGYRRCAAVGPAADHVVAFDRGGVIAVATRLPVAVVPGRRVARHLSVPSGSTWRYLVSSVYPIRSPGRSTVAVGCRCRLSSTATRWPC